MKSRGYSYNKRRRDAYLNTYDYYELPYIYWEGRKYRAGYLKQEPNPDYDKWLPENCEPCLIKDLLERVLPPNMIKPKIGPKGNWIIRPLPVVCIENETLYKSVSEAARALGISCPSRACGGLLFESGLRFTYIHPFINDPIQEDELLPDYDTTWPAEGFHQKIPNWNHNSAGNNKRRYLDKTTGKIYESLKDVCEDLHTHARRVYENRVEGHNLIEIGKE